MNQPKVLFILTFLVSLVLCAPAVCATKRAELQLRSLVPGEKELKDVMLPRNPDYYGPGNVSFYIEGEEKEFLREYGLEGLIVTSYYKAGEIITTEIYKLPDYRAAYGLFTAKRIPRDGSFSVGDGCIQSRSSIIFWQDAFFVKLITLGSKPDTLKAMEKIARFISRKIKKKRNTVPYYVKYLPTKDLAEDSIKVIRGPIGFKKYFSYGPSNVLDSKGDVQEGVIARYSGQDEFSYCLLRYRSRTDSIEALDKILASLKRNSTNYRYLFDVLMYKDDLHSFKINRIGNYVSIFTYQGDEFKYDWFLNGIKEKIPG